MRKRIFIALFGSLCGVIALTLVLTWAVGAQGPEPGLGFQLVDTFGETGAPYFSTTTHLNYPCSLAVDGTDNVYVAELRGHRVLKYDSGGSYQNLQIGIAGVEFSCWGEEELLLSWPTGLAVDSSDNIWVTERHLHRVSIFAPDGTYTGQLGSTAEQGSDNEHFNRPEGVALDSIGRIYVADQRNDRVQIFDSNRDYLTTIGGTCGSGDDQLCAPHGLAIGSGDVLYVADTENARVQVYQWVGDSMVFVQSITTTGTTDFSEVPDVAVDAHYLYVAEEGQVHVFSRSGVYSSTIGGWGGSDVAVDSEGKVYVAQGGPCCFWVVKCDGGPNWTCDPFAGTKGVPYLTDDSHFNEPSGVAVWGDLLFVIEGKGQRLLKLNDSGVAQWKVGEAGVDLSDNDHFDGPAEVAVDSYGRSYVADWGNHRVQIFDSDGNYDTTLGYEDCDPDDGLGTTGFCGPKGVAIGLGDAIYVADTENHRVQIFNSDGSYYGTLGMPGEPGDDNAHFDGPEGVTVDSSGNIYVADAGNRRVQIFDSSLTYQMTLGRPGGSDFADAGGPYAANEGDTVTLDASGSSDPGGFDHVRYPGDVAVDNSGRIYVADGCNPLCNRIQVFDSNGDYLTTIGGDCGAGPGQLSYPQSVDVDSEGYVYVADSNNHRIQKFAPDGVPPTPPTLSYEWDLDNDGEYDDATGVTTNVVFEDNGSYTVGLKVRGTCGARDTDTAIVTVNNVAATVGEISAPMDPIQVGTAVDASATFTDPGVHDTHTAVWDWGDGSTSSGSVNETNGSGSVSGSHTYTTPGVYTVKLTVTDDDGDSGESAFQYVVIYDPSGGFVTGGGWINSPEGAYIPDPSLTGKATFGFVAKYKKGAKVPTGKTDFRFRVADLNFHSDTYQWLVVAGPKAQFKGTGTINGEGECGLMLTAIDGKIKGGGGSDKFRIKIWDKATDEVIYDNQVGDSDDADPTTIIGGGSIVIHKKK